MRGYETARQLVARTAQRCGRWRRSCWLVESLDADGIKAIMASAA